MKYKNSMDRYIVLLKRELKISRINKSEIILNNT